MSTLLPPANPPSDTDNAARMLQRGHELTSQLRLLLLEVPPEYLPDSSWLLLDDVLHSLGLVHSAIKSWEKPSEHHHQSAQRDISPSTDDHLRSELGSSEKRKRVLMAMGDDDHRKKRSCPYSRTMVTAAPYDDGYQWRKYGQKKINGAKYPRSYFRCTYSKDQNCPASKQVQQTDNDDPPRFLTIYMHEHTCGNGQTAPHVIVESNPTEKHSVRFVPRSTDAPLRHLFSSELADEQERFHDILAKRSYTSDFFGSEFRDPIGQFWMNDSPDVHEEQPTAAPLSPQSSEIEMLVDRFLRN